MANTKITDLSALGAAPATNDQLVIVDVSDTTMAASGTDKKMTVANLFTSPSLTTPALGAATATSINGLTLTSSTGTLTVANGSTLATSGANSITLTSSGATNVTLPTTGTLSTLAGTEELDNKTLDSSVGKGTWTASGTWTLPAITAGGNITLAENSSIALDPAGSADGKYTGITVTGIGGATIAFGDLITLDKDDSRWELVDISVAAAATGDARGLLGMAVTSSSDGAAVTVLLNGIIRADANFPTLTIGAPVYASTTGDVVVAQPTTTDHVIRIIGSALTADELYFCPDAGYTTHT